VKSVSATTRAPRPGEVDGIDYRFITEEEFARLDREDAFLETAEVFGRRYGTPRTPVEEAVRAGHTVVLEIDVQGARQVKERMPDALTVFVDPPSLDDLRARLEGRGTEGVEAVRRRLAEAEAEIAGSGWFDDRVTNDHLAEAAEEVLRILDGARPPSQGEPHP